MSSPRVQANPQSSLPFGEEAKPGFRTKTAATRLTPEELGEIEAAAECAGQVSPSGCAGPLCARRDGGPLIPSNWCWPKPGRCADALLNLFHAASQAASEGRQLSPDSVLKIRDQADARKLQQARKLLDDFFAREGKERACMP